VRHAALQAATLAVVVVIGLGLRLRSGQKAIKSLDTKWAEGQELSPPGIFGRT